MPSLGLPVKRVIIVRGDSLYRPYPRGCLLYGRGDDGVRVLVASDDTELRRELATGLAQLGAQALPRPIVEGCEPRRPAVAVVDLRGDGAPGLALVESLKRRDPAVRVVAIDDAAGPHVDEAERLGVERCVYPPVDAGAIRDALRAHEIGGPVKLRDAHRDHIEHAFRLAGGKVAPCARRLGVPRSQMQRILRRYGLR